MAIRHDEQMIVNGRLTQVGLSFSSSFRTQRHRAAVFQCECGAKVIRPIHAVKSGNTKSCGCFRSETTTQTSTTHGNCPKGKVSPTYVSWYNLLSRMKAKEGSRAWEYYGSRGVQISSRWLVFEEFLADMGDRPHGCTLDRIDNNGDYNKQNCRWATRTEQNTRVNRILEHAGESHCMSEWAERTGISYGTIKGRLKRGWAVEDALTIPAKTRRNQ
jgi:hypothetical protein